MCHLKPGEEVEELTEESLREYYRRFKSYEELARDSEMWANVTRQARLQHALLEDEEALHENTEALNQSS